ncbi:hypothetical protein MGYG_01720 [Nannizzia gypsea CBS 118893]|uniref:Uncharacterized protein n=1 Tax=Arthroderma gypseum (strain ATCC MYA-4604 / CBS 118893) TaxID=535722 RepID=E5R2Z8_ARTGP|nr:hypothetical protein MGYG_01720 [Nannizzia gypsea CBS 118893]EFQ98702.1 hypothetical protein MGYG_01720 [Nannizzia gypsea CBS 118893]
MVSIFCPWRRKPKKVSPRGSSSDQTECPQSLPPVFEPITYTPLDSACEEQQMLDAIFSSANAPAPDNEARGGPPPEANCTFARAHSKNGRSRLGSLGGRFHRRFSRDGRLQPPCPTLGERASMCDSGHASIENKPFFDVLDSGNTSENAYDSDAHKLLTPQITARLKSSPGNRTILENVCSPPVRDIQSLSREKFCLGLDGAPASNRGSQTTETVDLRQAYRSGEDGVERESSAERSNSTRKSTSIYLVSPGPDSGPVTPLKTHITRASCSIVEDDYRKTPTLTPSDLGASDNPDKEISPLSLADSPESIQIYTESQKASTSQGVSQSSSPQADDTQVRINIGTSVYSSQASETPQHERNLESFSVIETPVHQVKKSLTSNRVSPENIPKQRAPANTRREPSIATQRDSCSIARRSRFIEDLDDVFTLKFDETEPPKEDYPEEENTNRRLSDGWLSGGKRLGYGYNFSLGERYPRLSCSEGAADEKYNSAIRLQSYKNYENGAPSEYRLPIQDYKRASRQSDNPDLHRRSRTATREGSHTIRRVSPFNQSDLDRSDHSRRVTSAIASLARRVRRHRRDASSCTASSSRSNQSHGLEPFPPLGPEIDLEMPLGFDPTRRDIGSGVYNRNPGTIKLVQALRGPSHPAEENTKIYPMAYDGFSDSDDDGEDIQPEPISAEVWSRLYDDCLQNS